MLTLIVVVSMRPRNTCKDMLNNMINLIDHVVMNHQNYTRTFDNKAIFATTCNVRAIWAYPHMANKNRTQGTDVSVAFNFHTTDTR
jgi:hypothetical protein